MRRGAALGCAATAGAAATGGAGSSESATAIPSSSEELSSLFITSFQKIFALKAKDRSLWTLKILNAG